MPSFPMWPRISRYHQHCPLLPSLLATSRNEAAKSYSIC
uniref:Uncharacterized protein n=1 Tax=Arundo donax TaxID=35708 RepID=A0A0A8ZWE0_ARUDO